MARHGLSRNLWVRFVADEAREESRDGCYLPRSLPTPVLSPWKGVERDPTLNICVPLDFPISSLTSFVRVVTRSGAGPEGAVRSFGLGRAKLWRHVEHQMGRELAAGQHRSVPRSQVGRCVDAGRHFPDRLRSGSSLYGDGPEIVLPSARGGVRRRDSSEVADAERDA